MRRKRVKVRFISINPAMSFFNDGMGFQTCASFRIIGAKVIKSAQMRNPCRDSASMHMRLRIIRW